MGDVARLAVHVDGEPDVRACHAIDCLGFRAEGLGVWVSGLEFRVQGSGCRVQGVRLTLMVSPTYFPAMRNAHVNEHLLLLLYYSQA